MSGVYRIKDRFVIKGRGIVYIFIFKPNCRDILRIFGNLFTEDESTIYCYFPERNHKTRF